VTAPAIFTIAGAAIMAVLGTLHLIYTLRDFGPKPRYFRPLSADLLDNMRKTKTALAPKGKDYWSGILGFHLSHCIGVYLTAVLAILTMDHSSMVLRCVIAAIPFAYAAIGLFCWFRTPVIGASLAGALLMVGAFL
jgi:hypothetical protein